MDLIEFLNYQPLGEGLRVIHIIMISALASIIAVEARDKNPWWKI